MKVGRPSISKNINIKKQCLLCFFNIKKRDNCSWDEYSKKKFCSNICYSKYPKPPSPKIGTKTSLETKLKQSLSQKRIGNKPPILKGKNNPRWKGGVTPINEKIRKSKIYKEWRILIYKRDNYTCVLCGIKGNGKNLNADHIKPFSLFPELRFAIDNGRTLCVDCHKKTPTYGWNGVRLNREWNSNAILLEQFED